MLNPEMLITGPDLPKLGIFGKFMETLQSKPDEIIKLIIRTQPTKFATFADFELALLATLGCEMDYLRRILKGSRPLRPKHVKEISKLLDFEIDFSMSEKDLVVKLGLSSSEAENYLDRRFSGIDFVSRTSDLKSIKNLFDLIDGYWECVYRSFSRTDQQAISRELFIVDGINKDNFITCRMRDVKCTNSGVIFPVIGQLYIMLEKERLFDEVIVHLTNRPDRWPPLLRGVVIGLSGGIDEIHTCPGASKVAFRYLGKTPEEVQTHYPDAPDSAEMLEDYLAEQVIQYIEEEELEKLGADVRKHLQIPYLDNTISSDQIPFILRADQ